MKKNTLIYRMAAWLLLVPALPVLSQPYLAWEPGSATGTILYDPAVMPQKGSPQWTDFYINPENTVYELNDKKLNLNTNAGSVYGYQLTDPDFSPQDAFTLQVQGELLSDTAALGLNLRFGSGKSISLNLKKNSVVDVNGNTVIADGLESAGQENYRISVDGDDAALYKGFDLISALNTVPGDVIKDGGFETMSSEDAAAYWGHDSWTQISVVTSQKHTGSKSMKWDSGWTGRFMGTISVQPNTTYKLSYWALFEPQQSGWGYGQMSGGVYMNDVEIAGLPISGSGWNQYSCDFTTDATTTEISMYYHNGWTANGNFIIYFDDIDLERISGGSFLQIGNLYPDKNSDINIGRVSFVDGVAYRPVLLSDLNNLISDADNALSAAVAGVSPGQYPQYAIDRFSSVVGHAGAIASAQGTVPDSVDVAYAALQAATDLFNRSVITGSEPVLAALFAGIDDDLLKENHTARIRLTGESPSGEVVSLDVADIGYVSLNPDILSVDNTGIVTGLAPGEGQIAIEVKLNAADVRTTLDVTVVEYSFSGFEFSPYSTTIHAGEATGTLLVAMMSDHTMPEQKDTEVNYNSLDLQVATVSENGSVIALKQGTAEIEAVVTVYGKTLKDTLYIPVIELESIGLNAEKTNLSVGEETVYTLSGVYSDGSDMKLDHTNSIIFSNNRNVVKVDDQGHLKADSVGTAVISVVVNKISGMEKQNLSLTVINTSSGLELMKEDECLAYPSPFTDVLTVSVSSEIASIELTDLSGKRLMSVSGNGTSSQSLNTSFLNPGIFFLKVSGKHGEIYVSKIIKQ